jgi:thiol:disulfide interchange protein DsbD
MTPSIRVPSALAALLVIALASAAVAGPPEGGDGGFPAVPSAPEADPVRARLVTTSNAVEPGGTVLVGVHLEQDDGWHTYWKNSGDAGLPTEIEWTLPEGWAAGPIQWPAPKRYVEAGDLITFGYSGDPVLLTRITAPRDARGPVTLRARADWLMCKELCIPGDAELELTLEVGGSAAPVPARDLELIEASRARLPVPARTVDGLDVATHLDLSAVPPGQGARAALVIDGLDDPTAAEFEWFPEAADGLFAEEADHVVDSDRLLIGVPFELEPGVEAGTIVDWGGVLVLTAADGARRFVEIELPVPVAAEGQAVEARSPEVFATLLGAGSTGGLFDQDFSAVAGSGPEGSLAYFLLLALVGGVILNVMPCVLPVLSLKVMGFVQHAGEDRAVQFRLGAMFAAGVLVSFLALAIVVIVLQAAGDQLGWGFQFQNPVFVLVMGAVVFAFGLSLFGVYEIVLPVQVGGGGGRGSAYAESFMNGVLATALATPCTAPLLGAALGFAFTQPPAVILAIFLTVGLGLSLPYVILSLNPGLLRFVPKPGPWMDTFKQAMGFLLMGTLIWLLWVLGQQVGTDGMIAALIFILVLGFALWMYGRMLDLNSSTQRRVTVWAVMVVLVAGSWWQFVHEPFSGEAIAAQQGTQQVASHGGGGTAAWEPFSVAALETAVAEGHTVFVDFTAAWCTTCKVNEKTVIMTEPVLSKIEELGVKTFVGDWTNRDEEITRVLRQFGRSGVPFYAVFPAGRIDSPIVLPEIITQSMVVEALEEAGPSRTVASR